MLIRNVSALVQSDKATSLVLNISNFSIYIILLQSQAEMCNPKINRKSIV